MPRKLWDFAVFVMACYAGYALGLAVGQAQLAPYVGHHPTLLWLLGGILVAVPVIWVGKLVATLIELDLEGHTSVLVRRPVGWIWRSVAGIVPAFAVILTVNELDQLLKYTELHPGLHAGRVPQSVGIAVLTVSYAIPWAFWWPLHYHVKHWLGCQAAPLRRIWRSHKAGKGGSAVFAGLFEEWRLRWDKESIFLGGSIYDPRWMIGIKDDRHCLSIAGSRAGKGRSSVIQTLLRWPHSALIIDPKGTAAEVTARARGNGGGRVKKGMSQDVYVLDPMALLKNIQSAYFNPLSILDPGSRNFWEDADDIAESLVVMTGEKEDDFFNDSARILLHALICFAAIKYGKQATLTHVRAMLGEIGKEDESPLIEEMLNCGGVVADGAMQIAASEPRARSGILITAMKHTAWLGSEPMQEILSKSSFDILDLKRKRTSIYLVVPVHDLHKHRRFLRLFVALTIIAASKGGKSRFPALFILDEAFSLGPLQSLAKAMGNLAGYNIKLWTIWQNLGQIKELYPRNWQTFLASTGFYEAFSINDNETAAYLSERLGRTILYGKDENGNKTPYGAVDLRDRVEVTQEASRVSGRKIVFREGEDPLVLNRVNYDTVFRRNQYDPDPEHEGS